MTFFEALNSGKFFRYVDSSTVYKLENGKLMVVNDYLYAGSSDGTLLNEISSETVRVKDLFSKDWELITEEKARRLQER